MAKNTLRLIAFIIIYVIAVKYNFTGSFLVNENHDRNLANSIRSQETPFYYLSDWYEIARMPNPAQVDCVAGFIRSSFSALHYNKSNTTTYKVLHHCKNDKTQAFKKFVYPLGDIKYLRKDMHGLLDEAFYFDIPYGKHKEQFITDTPYDYIIIVSGNYAWLLASERIIPKVIFEEMNQVLVDLGFDVSKLIISPLQTSQTAL